MRIRLPFAGIFSLLLLAAGYVGLASLEINQYLNDKILHLLTFFLLTLAFYWIVDTKRRRILNLTIAVCTVALGVGSELLQEILPNNRSLDLYDILANIVGSLAAVTICSWYHKRMLDRRRLHKQFMAVSDDDNEEAALELSDTMRNSEDRQLEEGLVDNNISNHVGSSTIPDEKQKLSITVESTPGDWEQSGLASSEDRLRVSSRETNVEPAGVDNKQSN